MPKSPKLSGASKGELEAAVVEPAEGEPSPCGRGCPEGAGEGRAALPGGCGRIELLVVVEEDGSVDVEGIVDVAGCSSAGPSPGASRHPLPWERASLPAVGANSSFAIFAIVSERVVGSQSGSVGA